MKLSQPGSIKEQSGASCSHPLQPDQMAHSGIGCKPLLTSQVTGAAAAPPRRVRLGAARCTAGSACSRELPNDASDAILLTCSTVAWVWRRSRSRAGGRSRPLPIARVTVWSQVREKCSGWRCWPFRSPNARASSRASTRARPPRWGFQAPQYLGRAGVQVDHAGLVRLGRAFHHVRAFARHPDQPGAAADGDRRGVQVHISPAPRRAASRCTPAHARRRIAPSAPATSPGTRPAAPPSTGASRAMP